MQRQILLLIILILVTPFILKAEEISLTLDEAIAIALRDNRDILLKAEDVQRAKEKIAEAKAGLLPSLNFTGSWTQTRGYYPKDINSTTTQTTLKQYLYKGGKTVNTIAQNKYKLEVSGALLDKTKLEVVFDVKKAFYTLLLANEFANLNKAILANTQEHLDFLQERYEHGQTSASELLGIEAAISSVQQVYAASLNQIASSQVLLNNLLYLDKDIRIRPSSQFNYAPQEAAYAEAFLKAMQTRPEIRQYGAQSEADKKAIEIAKADNRPSIWASWDYYSRSTTSLTFSPTKSWQDYNIIGFTFSWPIFDGWATKHKVEQAIVDLKETELLKEKTVKDIAMELKNAYLALKDALAKISAAESEVKVYSDNYSSVNQKYKQGIVSFLEVSDANLKYAVAAFNKNEAIYDYVIAKESFDKASGGI